MNTRWSHQSLSTLPSVKIYGPPAGPNGERRASLCAFNVEGIHATDLSTFLDQQCTTCSPFIVCLLFTSSSHVFTLSSNGFCLFESSMELLCDLVTTARNLCMAIWVSTQVHEQAYTSTTQPTKLIPL